MSRHIPTRPGTTLTTNPNLIPSPQRRHHTAWQFLASPKILAIGDALLLFVAFLLAYTTRYSWRLGPSLSEFQFTPLDAYWVVGALFIPVTMISFGGLGRYQPNRGTSPLEDTGRISLGVLIGTAAIIVVFFVFRPVFYSRLMFLYLGGYAIALATLWIIGRRIGLGLLRRAGYDNQRILIVGNGVVAKFLMQQLTASPSLGNRVLGYLEPEVNSREASFGRFQKLGQLADLEAVISSAQVDEVYVAMPSSTQHSLEPIISRCKSQDVEFRVVPDLLETQFGRMDMYSVAGIPLVTLRETEITGFRRVQKRSLDILISIIALAISAPFWACIAVAIRLDSKGSIFFQQTRIGHGGKSFGLLKFRSMIQDAEHRKQELFDSTEHPLLFKSPEDFRRTRVGRLLRRFSLDELPQLINVLRGDMSLVGPRAQVPAEVAQYDTMAQHRLQVLPGLTGLWQVSGRSDLRFEEMVMLDAYYVTNWSLGLDLRILLQTIPTVLSGRGAY